jgi:mediator of RNA polymerase II transcription subunit 17
MPTTASLTDVTLRPWPASKKDELSPQDLLHQVEQLANERGHLRNVTEKSLQEDIVAGKDAPNGATERLQDIFRMQQEMSSHME